MIKTKNRDMNRSRDVKGPELKRPADDLVNLEASMKDGKSLPTPTGGMEKFNLADLHHGDHETPLTAAGMQKVVESVPMGKDSADHTPVLHKGGLKDQSHFGGKGGMKEPKGLGRSKAKEAMYAEKKKDKY